VGRFFILKDQAKIFLYYKRRDISRHDQDIRDDRYASLTKPYSPRVAGVILRFVFSSSKEIITNIPRTKCRLLNYIGSVFMDQFEDK